MPTAPELELAIELARTVRIQAEGTKEHERLWISAAASLIERLLSGSATATERERAHAHLQLVREQQADTTPRPEISGSVRRHAKH